MGWSGFSSPTSNVFFGATQGNAGILWVVEYAGPIGGSAAPSLATAWINGAPAAPPISFTLPNSQ